jgi:hypothetical protein
MIHQSDLPMQDFSGRIEIELQCENNSDSANDNEDDGFEPIQHLDYDLNESNITPDDLAEPAPAEAAPSQASNMPSDASAGTSDYILPEPTLPHLKLAMEFIEALRKANWDSDKLEKSVYERLMNPQ